MAEAAGRTEARCGEPKNWAAMGAAVGVQRTLSCSDGEPVNTERCELRRRHGQCRAVERPSAGAGGWQEGVQ